jgi:hypothetical protein
MLDKLKSTSHNETQVTEQKLVGQAEQPKPAVLNNRLEVMRCKRSIDLTETAQLKIVSKIQTMTSLYLLVVRSLWRESW